MYSSPVPYARPRKSRKCTTKKTPRVIPYQCQNVRIELVREASYAEAPIITSSSKVYAFMREKVSKLDREHFWTLCLDSKNRIAGVNLVSIGTLSSAMIHPREVFKPAVLMNSASVIFVHNHPSGDITPSKEDIEITQRFKAVGEMLGIKVLDHVIIGEGSYASFADKGLL
jgi:DNA repair protein RadC